MIFVAVKNALISLLGAQAAGRYTVEGYRKQTHGAQAVAGSLRHVAVYYRGGQFEKGRSGWLQGPFRHSMTYAVELVLAAPARVDLAVLDNPAATPQARQSALAASIEAAAQADVLWDELAGILWNILIDPRNAALGDQPISDRWIGSIQKDNPSPKGEFVLLSGTMDYTCSAVETPSGEVGVPAHSIDVTLQETADVSGATTDPAKQGAEVVLP